MGGTNHKTSVFPQNNGDKHNSVQSVLFSLQEEATQEYLGEDNPTNSEDEKENGLPVWFDEERYKRGADSFEKNIFLMFTGKMCGLLSLLAVPSIVKVLVLTKQSGEPNKAFRRYVDTIRHMLFWYRSQLSDPKSLSRDSLRVVRNHHLRGTALARRAGLPGISQLDLALTQFAFFGFAVLRRNLLGLDMSDQEVQDFLHVWRTLGYLIGICDRFNLCQFDEDVSSTDQLLEGVCSKWLGPALVAPPNEFVPMSKALVNGVWCMMPVIEYNSILNFTQELAGVPQQHRWEQPGIYSTFMLAFLHLVPNTMTWPVLGKIFRAYHNANMRFSLYMSTYYPLLAWYSFPGNPTNRYYKLVQNEVL